jgi:hypothetical protein
MGKDTSSSTVRDRSLDIADYKGGCLKRREGVKESDELASPLERRSSHVDTWLDPLPYIQEKSTSEQICTYIE